MAPPDSPETPADDYVQSAASRDRACGDADLALNLLVESDVVRRVDEDEDEAKFEVANAADEHMHRFAERVITTVEDCASDSEVCTAGAGCATHPPEG